MRIQHFLSRCCNTPFTVRDSRLRAGVGLKVPCLGLAGLDAEVQQSTAALMAMVLICTPANRSALTNRRWKLGTAVKKSEYATNVRTPPRNWPNNKRYGLQLQKSHTTGWLM